MNLRTTYTVVNLPVSEAAYFEIRALLDAAGYQHCFFKDDAIDMTGIALTPIYSNKENAT